MTSTAYTIWGTERARRIDDLLAAHAALGGNRPGRRWNTESVNWSITLRLAAEFQGFSRDLHSEAVEHFSSHISLANPRLGQIIQNDLTRNRALDRGNANSGTLGSDFGRLGMTLWPALRNVNRAADIWNKHLDALNIARNAIAHSDLDGFAKLRTLGYTSINLSIVRRWRRSLDTMAITMDDVVADYLAGVLGGPRPW